MQHPKALSRRLYATPPCQEPFNFLKGEMIYTTGLFPCPGIYAGDHGENWGIFGPLQRAYRSGGFSPGMIVERRALPDS
jgi:hypothetical protein